jgi:hypothetical protein
MLVWIVAGVILACLAMLIVELPAIERRLNQEVGKAKRDASRRADELNNVRTTNP